MKDINDRYSLPHADDKRRTNNGSKNKMWLLIAGGAAIIFLAYILLGGGNGKNSNADAAPDAVKEVVATPTVQPAETKTAPVADEAPAPIAEKPDAKYDAGMKAYESGDGLKALENFKSSGSAKSYYMIGVIYENGCGSVGKNAMMARKNFKTAAQMGSIEAKAKL